MLLSCKWKTKNHVSHNRTSLLPFTTLPPPVLPLQTIFFSFLCSWDFLNLKKLKTSSSYNWQASSGGKTAAHTLSALLRSSDTLKSTAAAIFTLYSKVNVRVSARMQLDTHPAFGELASKKLTARQLGSVTEAAGKPRWKLKFRASLLNCTAGQKGKRNYSFIWGSLLPFLVEQDRLPCALLRPTATFSPAPLQNKREQRLTILCKCQWLSSSFFSRILAASSQQKEVTLNKSAPKTF